MRQTAIILALASLLLARPAAGQKGPAGAPKPYREAMAARVAAFNRALAGLAAAGKRKAFLERVARRLDEAVRALASYRNLAAKARAAEREIYTSPSVVKGIRELVLGAYGRFLLAVDVVDRPHFEKARAFYLEYAGTKDEKTFRDRGLVAGLDSNALDVVAGIARMVWGFESGDQQAIVKGPQRFLAANSHLPRRILDAFGAAFGGAKTEGGGMLLAAYGEGAFLKKHASWAFFLAEAAAMAGVVENMESARRLLATGARSFQGAPQLFTSLVGSVLARSREDEKRFDPALHAASIGAFQGAWVRKAVWAYWNKKHREAIAAHFAKMAGQEKTTGLVDLARELAAWAQNLTPLREARSAWGLPRLVADFETSREVGADSTLFDRTALRIAAVLALGKQAPRLLPDATELNRLAAKIRAAAGDGKKGRGDHVRLWYQPPVLAEGDYLLVRSEVEGIGEHSGEEESALGPGKVKRIVLAPIGAKREVFDGNPIRMASDPFTARALGLSSKLQLAAWLLLDGGKFHYMRGAAGVTGGAGVVVVGAGGLVEAKSAGHATLTLSHSGVSGSCRIQVLDLAGIEVLAGGKPVSGLVRMFLPGGEAVGREVSLLATFSDGKSTTKLDVTGLLAPSGAVPPPAALRSPYGGAPVLADSGVVVVPVSPGKGEVVWTAGARKTSLGVRVWDLEVKLEGDARAIVGGTTRKLWVRAVGPAPDVPVVVETGLPGGGSARATGTTRSRIEAPVSFMKPGPGTMTVRLSVQGTEVVRKVEYRVAAKKVEKKKEEKKEKKKEEERKKEAGKEKKKTGKEKTEAGKGKGARKKKEGEG